MANQVLEYVAALLREDRADTVHLRVRSAADLTPAVISQVQELAAKLEEWIPENYRQTLEWPDV